MCIIHCEVIRDSRNGCVHLSTSKILLGHNLTSRSLDEWWASKKNVALLGDDDGFVGHGWDIGTTCRAGSHHDGDLWDALAGHARLVEEDAPEVLFVWKDVGLAGEVGSAGVDEVDTTEIC